MNDYVTTALEILIGVVFVLIGWIFKMVFTQLKETDKSLQAHKLHAAETFATKVDVDKGFDRVMTKLDVMDKKDDENQRLLNTKIDRKADR